MALTDGQIRRAERAMRARMAGPRAIGARYDRRRRRVVVSLNNGLELAFPPELAEGLDAAAPADLAKIEITPTGLGLHWSRLDADLSVPGLLDGVFGSRRWMAGLTERKPGRARAATKAAAPSVNGPRGQRRKKAAGR